MTDIVAGRWFHGSSSDRGDFRDHNWDRNPRESSLNEWGPGIYWTSSREQAETYGPYLHEAVMRSNFCLVPMFRPTMSYLREFYAMAPATDQQRFKEDWGISLQEIFHKYRRQSTLYEALLSMYGALYRDPEDWVHAMVSLGFDGTIRRFPDRELYHLVVWSPEKLRITSL